MGPREILPTDQAHVLSRDVLVTGLKRTFRLSTRRQRIFLTVCPKPGCR
jgi:hypothetical protein